MSSSLFQIGMPYTTYSSGVSDLFNNKSRDLADPICGNDARVQIE